MGCKFCQLIWNDESSELATALSAYDKADYVSAFQLLLPHAEAGMVIAQCLIGGLYHLGFDVVRNEVEAKRWYLKAGEQGCGLAYNNLASIVMFSDPETAQSYYRKAKQHGFDMIPPGWDD